jgi:hypothetical protein
LFTRRRGEESGGAERSEDVNEITGDVLDVSLRLIEIWDLGSSSLLYEALLGGRLASLGYGRSQDHQRELRPHFEAAFRPISS